MRSISPLFLVTLTALTLLATQAVAADKNVSNVEELRAAISSADPGDVILLAPGTYRIDSKISITRAGTSGAPITLKSSTPHAAIIESDTVETFLVNAAYWIVEDLHFKGVCADDSSCEHALHIVGESDFMVVRGNRMQDYNAQIKGNGQLDPMMGVYRFPDDVLIEGNEFFDTRPRNTGNPVTKIDVVGGSRWVVRANYIHDFEKGGGDHISYAAFLKGGSVQGVFERNLVACEQLHSGGVRLGLSLGGGGTGPDSICQSGSCKPEHTGGTLRNNIIANCPNDVAIYLNAAQTTTIEYNTLSAGTGIDVRFEQSSAVLRGNLMSGKIRERNGGTITSQEDNLTDLTPQQLAQMFAAPAQLDFTLLDGALIVDKAARGPDSGDDFCANQRTSPHDIGAIEYTTPSPCVTSGIPPLTREMPMMPTEEMGQMETDMGTASPSDMGASPEDMNPSGGADLGASSDMGASDMAPSMPGPSDLGGSPDTDDLGTSAGADMGSETPEEEEPADCGGCASGRGQAPASALGWLGIALLLGWRRTRRSLARR